MSSVLVIGDALMDNQYFVRALPKAGQDERILSFGKSTGGSAANTAAALAGCGVKTYFCGSVGDDEDGQLFLDRFQESGVDTSLVQKAGKTGFTVTMIDASGERTMMSYRGASARAMQVSKELETKLGEMDVVLLSGYLLAENAQAQFAIEVAKAAKQSGCKVALDPSPVVGGADKALLIRLLGMTDVLLPNEDELMTIANMVGEVGVKCVATKLGSRGAKMRHHGQEFVQPIKKIKAVDTTGAGDAFDAGFIAAMLGGESPQAWLKKGVELAAAVVGKTGAV